MDNEKGGTITLAKSRRNKKARSVGLCIPWYRFSENICHECLLTCALKWRITSNYEVQELINSSWCSRFVLFRTGVWSKNLIRGRLSHGILISIKDVQNIRAMVSGYGTYRSNFQDQMYYINYCPTLYWQHLISY